VTDPSPDERLVEAALAGQALARRELAARLLDVIAREVSSVLRRSAAAQGRDARQELRDLVQEVLVSLFEHDCRELRRWDPARGRQLDSFVRLVARRKAARVLGQQKGNPWADLPVDPSVLESVEEDARTSEILQQIEQRDELGWVLDALYAHMNDRDFELFDLLFVQDLDPGEVAAALAMTRGAVNAWCYRTRKLARVCLAKHQARPSAVKPTMTRGEMRHD